MYRHLLTVGLILALASICRAEEPQKQKEEKQQPAAKNQSPVPGFLLATDVEYGKAGDRSLTLDLLYPDLPEATELPLIVWIHGGGWRNGSKDGGINRVLAAIGREGEFVVASIGYRLSGEAIWPAQIHDCKAAIRFLRANARKYGIDGDNIGVWGSSAGGHLVSLLGTSGGVAELEGENGTPDVSSRVQCVVDYCGPSDFIAFASKTNENAGGALVALFGGPVSKNEEAARLASPVTHVSDDDPPFLIVHGTEDGTVPIAQAELLYSALQSAGNDVMFLRMVGGGHGINGGDLNERVKAFFNRHLQGHEVTISEEPIDVAAAAPAQRARPRNRQQQPAEPK